MPPNDRNNPVRQASSESDYSLIEFLREYPDDAACLDRLWRERYAPDGHHAHCSRCDRERKFHRTRTRASYTCDTCGLHVHPMKGTIFEKSTTSLQLWFYAMYLMTSTRCGISAKQLERELGVTYKTAHRMMKRIRTELMTDDGDEPLSGDVEVDETSWGGKPRKPLTRSEAAAFREAKPTVLGMVERDGRVRARVITSRRGPALSREVRANVLPTSIIFTDDWRAYRPLKREYLDHRVINHSSGLYVDGSTHTNTIEGFFGNLKTGMRGAYKKVSPRYLQSYLNEYAWRYKPPPHRAGDVRLPAASSGRQMRVEAAVFANRAAVDGALLAIEGAGWEHYDLHFFPGTVRGYVAGVLALDRDEEHGSLAAIALEIFDESGHVDGSRASMIASGTRPETVAGVPLRVPFAIPFMTVAKGPTVIKARLADEAGDALVEIAFAVRGGTPDAPPEGL